MDLTIAERSQFDGARPRKPRRNYCLGPRLYCNRRATRRPTQLSYILSSVSPQTLPFQITHGLPRSMSALFGPAMLAAIQSFAGNAANFLDRTLEWPWYPFWVQAFYGVFDPTKVIAGPQYEIVKQIHSNDGKRKFKKRVPDFALHYLSGVPRNHDVDNLHQVTNHEELLRFSMGRFVLIDSVLLAICEIKALPDQIGRAHV